MAVCTELNGLLDPSEPVTHDVPNVHFSTELDSSHNEQYAFFFPSWRNSGETEAISITKKEYNIKHDAHAARIVTKRGLLGIEWIVSRELTPD